MSLNFALNTDNQTLGQKWWLCLRVSCACWKTDSREKRLLLQEEDREDSDQPGSMSTGPSWDVGTGHKIKKQMKGIAPCS
ncbi:hypothetical protein ACRRTK_008429 [Alexandromys fortis]